jgi:hypothetical protein
MDAVARLTAETGSFVAGSHRRGQWPVQARFAYEAVVGIGLHILLDGEAKQFRANGGGHVSGGTAYDPGGVARKRCPVRTLFDIN